MAFLLWKGSGIIVVIQILLAYSSQAKLVIDFTDFEELPVIEEKLINTNLDIAKISDTEKAIDGTVEMLADGIGDGDISLNLRTYVLKENRFQETNFNLMNLDFCDHYLHDDQMMKDARDASNATDFCPVKKGVYGLTNFMFDGGNLPDNFPEGSYKVELVFIRKPAMISVGGMNIFFDVKEE